MPLHLEFTCTLPNGLHARPASVLEEVARRFPAGITLTNERTGRSGSLKSVLAIVGTDTRLNDRCRVSCDGIDEVEAMEAISNVVRDRLPHCDSAPPRFDEGDGPLRNLSRALREAGGVIRRGVPAVPGVGIGVIVRHKAQDVAVDLGKNVEDVATEHARIEKALTRLGDSYDRRLVRSPGKTAREIVKVHRSIARDPEFRDLLMANVRQHACAAAGAVLHTQRHFEALLKSSGNAMIEERALDVADVCMQLLRQLHDEPRTPTLTSLAAASIVIAERLTPGQFLELDRRHLKGLALGQGGRTSHTVILAGSFGIPTLLGVSGLDDPALTGEAVLDAEAGALVTSLAESTRRYYAMEQWRLSEHRAHIRQFADRPGCTQDGVRLEVNANIVDATEVEAVIAVGAEGIGLFRTEALFLDRDSLPEEDEQYAVFARALAAAGDRPVVFRTLDVGADKQIPYLDLPREENPFLSSRGVGAYPAIEDVIRAHIRALLRAAPHGNLKVLIPMVADLDQVHWIKGVVAEEEGRLIRAGIPCRTPPLGAMIEVPSAVFLIEALCREFDFFSIGSNDLLQYFTAVDRASAGTATPYQPLSPGFLSLMRQAVDGARRRGRWIGLCGELAGDPASLPLLVGLNLDGISVSAPCIPAVKARLGRLSANECRALTTEALECHSHNEVAALLDRRMSSEAAPLLDPALVVLGADVASKAEALKTICDRLFVAGRTARPHDVEEAVWQREVTYSTGFGYGFAIPHCRTSALSCPALAVLKPRTPIPWGSSDDEPVRMVFFLGVAEHDQDRNHMQILSKLARLLMHEDFRSRVSQEPSAAALAALLSRTLYAD